jgi:hypothetical protein
MLQGHAVQKLHGNERLLTVLADFVDGANIGMIQSRGRTGLAAEAFQCLRVSRQFIGQEFEGDEAAKLGIVSLVDHTHPAATGLLIDAVVRDGLADHEQASYGGRVGKSMKAVGLAVFRKGCWRKIAITVRRDKPA